MYKIMLADDEGIVIDSLKFIIEKEFKDTCEVQYAKTGRSVIELAESFRPDVAVMDIQMPVLNGYETTESIRAGESDYWKKSTFLLCIRLSENRFGRSTCPESIQYRSKMVYSSALLFV